MASAPTPAPSIVTGVRAALAPHAPFSGMRDADLDLIVRSASVRYYAAGETLVAPAAKPPGHCFVVRQGSVRATPASPDATEVSWERSAGEMFPLTALIEKRSVTHAYEAVQDTFVIAFPSEVFDTLFERSEAFADFCRRRIQHLVELSRSAVQAEFAASVTEQRGPATPLGALLRHRAVVVPPAAPIGDALHEMEAKRIGSMIVVDEARRPSGIFTRQDVIGRVVLAHLPLDTPIGAVASRPVVTLPREATAGDAAVEMARHGVRHIVVVDATGRVDGVVSERDLFALQRLSVRELASDIRRAADVAALAACAANIRDLAHSLVAQGLASAQLTRTISSLNDQLVQRLIAITQPAHDLAGVAFCWLGMGSEGRNEQTIATDQDNGIVFDAPAPADVEPLRARLLPFARAVNEALDACGYPLCKGGVMAMNPRWCASFGAWRDAFRSWIERGDPQSLLDAQIFFDFRSLSGDARLAHALRDDIARRARATPRFLKQMSDNARTREPPLNWFGELSGDEIDLKLQGTRLFVDGARILALASGVTATSTVERFEGAGAALGIAAEDTRGWAESFEYLQLLRLRTQHRRATGAIAAAGNANVVPLDELSELDRRIVKEAMRQARLLQQRLALDYPG